MICPHCRRDTSKQEFTRMPWGFWAVAGIGTHAYPGTLNGMRVRTNKLNKQFPERKYVSMKTDGGIFIRRLK